MTEEKTQIVILGAGIAGCIAAFALAPFYSVLLIDGSDQPEPRVGECLAPAAGRILAKLGLADLLSDGHLISHGLLSYWGAEQPEFVDQLPNPDGHGWHLDRQLFTRQLRQQLLQRAIRCLWPASFTGCVKKEKGWQLQLQQGQQQLRVNCQLVIDATGRHSRFARHLGIGRQNLDQQLSIWLTALVKVRKQISVLSATEQGCWWYSAPLPVLPETQQRSGVDPESQTHTAQARLFALQLPPAQLDKSLSQSSTLFLQAAAKVAGLGTLVQQIVPGTATLHGIVAANSSKLAQGCGEGWFAIGDSALSFDPLSSQGMFNAMATAMQLADLLTEHGLWHQENTVLYQSQLDSIWQHYLAHKKLYYDLVSHH